MKTCKYCQRNYPETDFGVAKTTPTKVYRRNKCKHCYAATKKIRAQKMQTYIDNEKAKGCTQCGIKDIRCLEFHHVSNDKEANIAELRTGSFGWQRLKDEIAKCIVICANCHRIFHHEEKYGPAV